MEDFLKSAQTKKNYSYQAPNLGSLTSMFGGSTKPGQVNAQNMAPYNPNINYGANVPGVQVPKTVSPTKTATQTTQTNPYGALGNQQNLDALLSALNYSPSGVDVKIDPTIPSDALNTTQTGTTLNEKAKNLQNKVTSNRYDKEVEALMSSIASLNTGIANLKGTQAKEYANLETNPEGVFGPNALSSQLSRLSRDQAIELSARTGQLQAQLDTLKMYQGYAPSVLGTPQIDDATGEAFVYMQDPQSGEISVQSLGQVTTPASPDLSDQYMTVSEGATVFDRLTGQPIYTAPKTYKPEGGGGGIGGSLGGILQGAGLDSQTAYAFNKAMIGGSLVDEALNSIDKSGAGWGGVLGFLPGTKTKDFSNIVESIKSNIGFGELTAMRAASPTGGALGQVSERENTLLQSTLGSLSIWQSKEALKDNLQDINRSFKSVTAGVKLNAGIMPTPAELQALKDASDLYGIPISGLEGTTMKSQDLNSILFQ